MLPREEKPFNLKLSEKLLEAHGIFFFKGLHQSKDLYDWIRPIREQLIRLRKQLPKAATYGFAEELDTFWSSGQDSEEAFREDWSLEPLETKADFAYVRITGFGKSQSIETVTNEISACKQIAEEAITLRRSDAREMSWMLFLRNYLFKTFDRVHGISNPDKDISSRWALQEDLYWNEFRDRTNRNPKAGRLIGPKPDLTYAFPIIDTTTKTTAEYSSNSRVESFSLPVLSTLRSKTEVNLLSAPTTKLHMWATNRHLGLSSADLICFPWAIVEASKANENSCYCRAANASAAALTLRENLASQANDPSASNDALIIFAFTCSGPTVKLWITYRDLDNTITMKCIWATSLELTWGVMALRMVIKNMCEWVYARARPEISKWIQMVHLQHTLLTLGGTAVVRTRIDASCEPPIKGLSSSFLPASNTPQQTLAVRLDSIFSREQDCQEPYTDSEIIHISTLLAHSNLRWSKVPRTYAVLRTIGHLNLLNDFINVGFSDYWFPVTKRNIPEFLRPSIRAAFFNAQSLVLTKSMDLEKGEKGQHCHFKQGDTIPFETKLVLGQGGFGQVDKVLSTISFKEYARKRILRSSTFRDRRKEHVEQFIAEIEILKRLKHNHIVEYVGSYTDPKYLAVIMSPVAQMDLNTYLANANASTCNELRTFFGCLATALEFLHTQNVRHKDIKPGNILVDRGNVLYTDFGLSFDFTDVNGSTTTGIVNGRSPRYCAPEVAMEEPRNTTSDIWSLGVVFLEMVVVLKGKTALDLDKFLERHGSHQRFIRTNLDALPDLIMELESIGKLTDNRALGWIQQMLLADQQLRPTASSLVSSITAPSQDGERMTFCGICCVSSEEEDFSEWMDE